MLLHLLGAPGLKYLAEKYKSEYPTASSFVKKNFYVDGGLISVPSIQGAKELIVKAQTLRKNGGLRFHKFNSNENDVLHYVDSSECAVTTKPLNWTLEVTGYVISIQWFRKNDTFSFDI